MRIATPHPSNASACGHSVSSPTPFRKIASQNHDEIAQRNQVGNRLNRIAGMFSIGKMNPDRYIIGIRKKNVEVIIACCWV